jgi:Icc-related predicted phosphoesterase
MRRLLVAGQINGQLGKIDLLKKAAHDLKADLVVFTGGVVDAEQRDRSSEGELLRLWEQFFDAIGSIAESGVLTAVLPGPADAPLRHFLRLGMYEEGEHPKLHLIHATLLEDADMAICGVGGEITEHEELSENRVRTSRSLAEYYLRKLWESDQSRKVLVLSQPPSGQLGGHHGNRIIGEFLDSYHPSLCLVGGPTEHRGWQRVAHTLVINPGRLVDNSVAWYDASKHADLQVDLLYL